MFIMRGIIFGRTRRGSKGFNRRLFSLRHSSRKAFGDIDEDSVSRACMVNASPPIFFMSIRRDVPAQAKAHKVHIWCRGWNSYGRMPL